MPFKRNLHRYAVARSKQRSGMLGVVASAERMTPPSSTSFAAAASAAAAVLGAPCETDAAARSAGIALVGTLINKAAAGGDVELSDDATAGRAGTFHHVVALQVAFERQTLKPVFHLKGYRLWV